MAYFNGTFGADRITTTGVSAGVTANPVGSRPGDGGDIILGQGGDDYLSGGGGNDLIMGGWGNDAIFGGAGADNLHGGDGDDVIYNASTLTDAVIGLDYVYGGNGNDTIYASGFGSFEGNAGDDTFIVRPSLLTGLFGISGGTGTDTLDFSQTQYFHTIDLATREVSTPNLVFGQIENVIGNNFANRITGDANDNELHGNGGRDTIDGGDGDNRLFGGSGGDVIYGGNGHDLIEGGSGDDILFGSAPGSAPWAWDVVYGDGGNDIIQSSGFGRYYGGSGDDYFVVEEAWDQTVWGGSGTDTLRLNGGGRNTEINLGTGYSNVDELTFYSIENLNISNELYGGNDIVRGSDGDNDIRTGNGVDVIFGEDGNDHLWGGRDRDVLYGDDGNDTLDGGDGNDNLKGGLGADVLDGGSGDDRFIFGRRVEESQGWTHDTILGFDGAGDAEGDTIGLNDIDADTTLAGNQAFVFLGAVSDATGMSYGAGHLWTVNTGSNTYVRGNVDGDDFLELTILIEDGADATASDYTADDFFL
ncbi:calcium-binding protein [Amaricoccus tamworthensis]|uniref:calcium-binding protein n=1 Tax=Amaricoccus tamworthensis TaxID=57002 RepID=UPI003C7C7CC7